MRLLHVTGGDVYGGIERMIATLASTEAPGVRQCVAASPGNRLWAELARLDVDVTPLPFARASRPLSVMAGRRAFSSLLQACKPDAVIFHGSWTHAMFARTARAHGSTLVFWQHAPVAGRGWLERWASRTRPDLQVANSRFTASAPAFPALPSRVIYCPVGPASPAPAALRHAVRGALGASDDDVVVLTAARFEAWKGHTVLIEAARLLRARPLKFWVAGGAQRLSERAYAAQLERQVADGRLQASVALLGDRTDVPALMRAADIYCQPNIAPEPFGVAIAEAMHAGLPSVVSRGGGAVELIDERSGCLTDPGNAPAVAAGIARLADDAAVRLRMGRAAAARAAELTDPRSRLADLIHLIAAAPANAA